MHVYTHTQPTLVNISLLTYNRIPMAWLPSNLLSPVCTVYAFAGDIKVGKVESQAPTDNNERKRKRKREREVE